MYMLTFARLSLGSGIGILCWGSLWMLLFLLWGQRLPLLAPQQKVALTNIYIYIERVSQYKYLDIWLDDMLSFKALALELANKVKVKLGVLYRIRSCLSRGNRLLVVQSCQRPVSLQDSLKLKLFVSVDHFKCLFQMVWLWFSALVLTSKCLICSLFILFVLLFTFWLLYFASYLFSVFLYLLDSCDQGIAVKEIFELRLFSPE